MVNPNAAGRIDFLLQERQFDCPQSNGILKFTAVRYARPPGLISVPSNAQYLLLITEDNVNQKRGAILVALAITATTLLLLGLCRNDVELPRLLGDPHCWLRLAQQPQRDAQSVDFLSWEAQSRAQRIPDQPPP